LTRHYKPKKQDILNIINAKPASDQTAELIEWAANQRRELAIYSRQVSGQLKKQAKNLKERYEFKDLARKALRDANNLNVVDEEGNKILASVANNAEDLIDVRTRAQLKISAAQKLKMGGTFSPLQCTEARVKCALLSSLNSDEEVYVPLDVNECVCINTEDENYLFKQISESEVQITTLSDETLVATKSTGETFRMNGEQQRSIGIGSVVTTSSSDTDASSGASTICQMAFSLIATCLAMLLF